MTTHHLPGSIQKLEALLAETTDPAKRRRIHQRLASRRALNVRRAAAKRARITPDKETA